MITLILLLGFSNLMGTFVVECNCTISLLNQSHIYDIESLVTELGLQFCTIVEIGQGVCSLFLEVRDAADLADLKQGSVAEVFLGECQCSLLREWSLCTSRLIEARGETCRFKEATGRDPSSQRVHRRMCDFDHLIKMTGESNRNRPCDCQRRIDDRTSHPVKGLGTCFRSPLPNSVCGRHSVCGVFSCSAVCVEGYTMVQCDKTCKGRQPFCEDIREKAPIVKSYWSEWSRAEAIGFGSVKVNEAICLSANTRAPAVDCLGPGPYCCPPEDEFCFCDVEYTVSGKKVRRFSNIEAPVNLGRTTGKKSHKVQLKQLLAAASL